MKEMTLEEVHAVLLEIAKVFHRICVEHNIPYYMLGGTMLGAVRHKGFIPWDDDMDFGVPREHFESLKEILEKKLPPQYRLLTMDNSDALVLNFVKIEDTRTLVNERFKEDARDTFGLNIDIFPLDKCNGKMGFFSRNYMIRTLVRCQFFRFSSAKDRKGLKKAISYALKLALPLMKHRTIIDFAENRVATTGDYCANIYGAWGFKEIVPSVIFENSMLYDFEDTQFYGTKDSGAYLSHLYGDYMKLPPEEKRRVHIVNSYWR